jgi:hypothetical protein
MAALVQSTNAEAHHEAPASGARVRVRLCRGRVAPRSETVVGVPAFAGARQGQVVVVRWDEDGSLSCLVPGMDIEVIRP